MQQTFQQNLELQQREYAARKVSLASLPTKLYLPVSESCNLHCFMCGIGVNPEKYKIYLSQEMYQHCYELFPYLNHVDLGLAEIFAEEEGRGAMVDEVIERARDFPHLKLGGVTNGMLLGKERIKAIVEKFDTLNLSVDSPDSAAYESIKAGAKLGILENNLKNINEMKTKLGRRPQDYPQLHFSAIIMERTYGDLVELVRFISKMGGVLLVLRPLIQDVTDSQWEGIKREDILADKPKLLKYLEIAAQAKKMADKMGIKVLDNTLRRIRRSFPELIKPGYPAHNRCREPAVCALGWRSFYVTSRGLVTFGHCSRTIIGDLSIQSAKAIWNSEAARQERKNLIKGNTNCRALRWIREELLYKKGGGNDAVR